MVLQLAPSIPPSLRLGRQEQAADVSDSDATHMNLTQSSSASEDEEAAQMLPPRPSKAPLRKRPSLQKRKKPMKRLRAHEKSIDPFDTDELLKPSETMDEEMNAMKQVFMRMSEKKLQQKEERKAECKRLYKEAFQTDVAKIFRKASKARTKAMDTTCAEIDEAKSQLIRASEKLRDAYEAYKQSFTGELARAEAEIQELRAILVDLDSQYASKQKSIDAEYNEITLITEDSLQELEKQLIAAHEDQSFLVCFRPHIERLM